MQSAMDTDVLVNVCRSLVLDIKDKGFLPVCTDVQIDSAKTLLFLFSISHIVVSVQPSINFDLNYLHLFRILDKTREKALSFFSDILAEVPLLSREWVDCGRPCSPRMLFVFEAFGSKRILRQKRLYELQLEDQIYRFLRKSRIITNICANSLFAICNQMDFVHIVTNDVAVRDPNRYLSDLLLQYCTTGGAEQDFADSESDALYNFLWSHINIAQTKGFDDNVGRHNVTSVFERPTVSQFVNVVGKLSSVIFGKAAGGKMITKQLRDAMNRFVPNPVRQQNNPNPNWQKSQSPESVS